MPDDLWSDADIIDIYTRRQAIEDGVLVQLSGPGYEGDPCGCRRWWRRPVSATPSP